MPPPCLLVTHLYCSFLLNPLEQPTPTYLQRPCRLGLSIDHSTVLVGALVQCQRLLAHLGQGLRAELLEAHQRQLLFLLLFGTPPVYPNVAHPWRVVLELVGSRHARLKLLGHQDFAVALNGSAGALAGLVDPGTVVEIGRRRRVPLGVVGATQSRVCQHGYPRSGTLLPSDPGGGVDELAVLVLLRILTQQPHVAVVVLGKEGDLCLAQLSCSVIFL